MKSRYEWPSLAVTAWPPRDRTAWTDAQRQGEPLEPGGPAAGLAQQTRVTMQLVYAQFLYWLQERGELDPQAGPADRLTHQRFVLFVTERRASVSDNTVFNNLRMLAMILKCMSPGTEWGWIYRHPLAPRRHEAAAARRPVPIVQPGLLFAGLQSGISTTMTAPVTMDNAIRMRDLLMVAVTATTALRLRNILAMTLGESILKHRHGYEIRFPANAVKNSRAISMMLMSELAASFERYVEIYRPVLLRGLGEAGGALWVSNEGRRISEPSAHQAFARVSQDILGRKVNPHSLRHSAVTAILTQDPLAVSTASAVLAHKDTTTLDRFYDRSGDAAAQTEWRKLLSRFRKPRDDQG